MYGGLVAFDERGAGVYGNDFNVPYFCLTTKEVDNFQDQCGNIDLFSRQGPARFLQLGKERGIIEKALDVSGGRFDRSNE